MLMKSFNNKNLSWGASLFALALQIGSANAAAYAPQVNIVNDETLSDGVVSYIALLNIQKGTYTVDGKGTVLNINVPQGQPKPEGYAVLTIGDGTETFPAVETGLTVSNGASVVVGSTLNIGSSFADGAKSVVKVDGGRLSAEYVVLAYRSDASLIITNGGVFTQTNSRYPFYGSGTSASASGKNILAQTIIDGAGSLLSIEGDYRVNHYGDAVVNVTNGGAITSNIAFLGNWGGNGVVNLDGPNVSWKNAGRLSIATSTSPGATSDLGSGVLNIKNGASFTTTDILIGTGNGTGHVNVTGSNTYLNAKNSGASFSIDTVSMNIGKNGSLTVSDKAGAKLQDVIVAGNGSIFASSGASVSSNELYVGNGSGVANFTLTGAGTYWSTRSMVGVGVNAYVGTGAKSGGPAGDGKVSILDGASLFVYSLEVGALKSLPDGSFEAYSGEVIVDGEGSSLTTIGQTKIGTTSTGKLVFSNKALGSLKYLKVGTEDNSNGSVYVTSGSRVVSFDYGHVIGSKNESKALLIVDGAGTTYESGDMSVYGSSNGNAIFSITNGATASTGTISLFSGAILNIDGTETKVEIGDPFREIFFSLNIDSSNSVTNDAPIVKITNNAYASANSLKVTGTNANSLSQIEISNGATFNVYQPIVTYGAQGATSLIISGGSTMTVHTGRPFSRIPADFFVGTLNSANNGNNTILVDGVGSKLSVGRLILSAYGSGGASVLTLSNSGTLVSKNSVVLTQEDAAAVAKINIGAAAGDAPVAPGFVEVPQIIMGQGTSTINFNHTSNDYTFTAQIEDAPAQTEEEPGSPQLQIDDETSSSSNGTINQIAGRTRLTADSSGFNGQTNIIGGSLVVNGYLGGNISVESNGLLEGVGNVGNVINAGLIQPGDGEGSIGTLTINGNYVGNGGSLLLDTVLGDSNSLTDKLIISGNASGNTSVVVTNRGGLGALTTGNGIEVISVGGTSQANAFTLKSDYQFEGQNAVVGGAYAYSLYQGSAIFQTDDNNWYLRTFTTSLIPTDPLIPVDPNSPISPSNPPIPVEQGSPVYQPGVPLYEAYPQILLQMNKLGTLEQRVGNRTWLGQNQDNLNNVGVIEGSGFWMKLEGLTGHLNSDKSKTKTSYDFTMVKTQLGVDFVIAENNKGTLIGGAYFQYDYSKADVFSRFGKGDIQTNGYGLGGTLTWYGNNGFYVDGVAQAMWYKSDINSDTLNRRLSNENDGFGYALSIEAGKKFALQNGWTLTPQAQLSYNSVDFDSFRDPYSAKVSRKDGDALTGRVGVALDRESAWKSAAGDMRRLKVYGIANLYYEFLDGTQVEVTGVKFGNRPDRFWGGLGAGLSHNWGDDKYSIYGEVDARSSFSDFGNSYFLSGTVGFRAKF